MADIFVIEDGVTKIALQIAKGKKIAEMKRAGVDAVLSSLLSGVADSSFEILSNTKSSTVVLLKIAKNTGVFKLGTDSAKWLPKIKKVIEVFSDSSKSGADIFAVIQEQKLPLASIPAKKAENMTLKAVLPYSAVGSRWERVSATTVCINSTFDLKNIRSCSDLEAECCLLDFDNRDFRAVEKPRKRSAFPRKSAAHY